MRVRFITTYIPCFIPFLYKVEVIILNIKKIICLISAVLIVLINLSLTAYAAETTISDTEAKKLILGAHNLYLTYQDGIYDTVKHEIVTTTKEAVSKEAKKIYIEEIADDMWMYRCDLGAEYCKSFDGLPYIEKDVQGWFDGMKYQIYNIDGKRIDMYNHGLTYLENADGTITFIPFIAQSLRQYYLVREYSEEAFVDYPTITPTRTDEIFISDLTGNAESAICNVIVYLDDGYLSGSVTLMDVEFRNTDSGWRISGGKLVNAFSNWYDESMKKYYDNDEKYIPPRAAIVGGDTASAVATYAVRMKDPGGYYVYEKEGKPYSPFYDEAFKDGIEFSDWRMIWFKGDMCAFALKSSEDGKTYDAIFKYDPDFVSYHYMASSSGGIININWDKPLSLVGNWRLVGGGVYEMATGKTDVAPYTGESGDFTGSVITMSIIAVLSFCLSTMLVVRRKRKADLSQ